jgi:hypothetical protein
VFTESLPSNGRLFWLHYSDFRASCHNIFRHLHGSVPSQSLPLYLSNDNQCHCCCVICLNLCGRLKINIWTDWNIGVRSLAEAESFHHVQIGSEHHVSSYTKRLLRAVTPGVFKMTTHPHLGPRLRMSRNLPHLPRVISGVLLRQRHLFLTIKHNKNNKEAKLSLCLIKHHGMKTYGGGGVAPPFLTSALDGSEWSASRPCRFTPGERAPGTHWIGCWVGLSPGLDAVEKRKILHCGESNPGSPALSPSLYWLRYPNFRRIGEWIYRSTYSWTWH